jgi:hypothetical protein
MAIYKNTPPIVTNGLVLHLDAGSGMSYTSGSTTWGDLSGRGFNASMSGSVSFSGSLQPPCFIYSGGTPYFSGSNNLSSSISTEITLMTVATITNMAQRSVPFNKYQSAGIAGYLLEIGTVGGLWTNTMRFFAGGSNAATVSCDYRGTTQLSANVPYLFTVVFSKVTNTVAMYYNTTEMTATQAGGGGNIPNMASDWAGGTNNYSIGSYLPAVAGIPSYMNQYNTLVYNRALSIQEITQNYNAFKTRFNLS